jgi:hypothetical protein
MEEGREEEAKAAEVSMEVAAGAVVASEAA